MRTHDNDTALGWLEHAAPEDVAYAAQWGGTVKLIGRVRRAPDGRAALEVSPMLVPGDCLLSGVSGVFNAIQVTGDMVGTTLFYGPGAAGEFDFSCYDYVVDAIDTVTGKLALIQQALEAGTSVISWMGAGNKLDPARLELADISRVLGTAWRRPILPCGEPSSTLTRAPSIPAGPIGLRWKRSGSGSSGL